MQNNYYSTAVTPQRVPGNFDMNHLYLSPSQQQTNRTGSFLKRNEKIDWRRIAAVDVDRIARDMDFNALQDNLEHITLCNIDAEIDSRAMDPNFIKLYKLAQLTIEYLLLCQEQITTHLADYEQVKNKGLYEQDHAQQEIQKLKVELLETKKESKKRRKMLETQQRMLMAQNSNYHTCPVCTHAFLSANYLQAHMHRRHPDYNPPRRREHDIDIEKEIQRLKDELNKKEHELQLVQVQKKVDEEKIQDRDTNIRQLKEENQALITKTTILDNTLSQMRNIHTRSPSSQQHDTDISELLKENKKLYSKNKELEQLLQTEKNFKEKESIQQYQQENEYLKKNISDLQEKLKLLQNSSGDTKRLSEELIAYRDRYNNEKIRRKKLEEELREANNQSELLRKQLSRTVDHKLPTRSNDSSVQEPVPSRTTQEPVQTRPTRPIQAQEIILQKYCPHVVERIRDNPKVLTKYRDEAKKQFLGELEDYESLGIAETDTRLTDLDFRTKMEHVLRTRRNIQEDLPNFERIRDDISRTLDKLVNERLNVRHSITSIRSTSSKLVTFKDDNQQQKDPTSIYDSTRTFSIDQRRLPTTTTTTVQSKSKYDHSHPTINNDSDEDVTISNANEDDDDEDTQPTKPGVKTDIQPSPRRNPPPSKTTTGVSSLVSTHMRPSTATTGGSAISALVHQPIVKPASKRTDFNSDSENENESDRPVSPMKGRNGISSLVTAGMRPSTTTTGGSAISALVRQPLVKPTSTTNKFNSDSESGSPIPPHSTNITEKTRIIERKLYEASTKGQKPTSNAIAQGFKPSRESFVTQNNNDDDDDDDNDASESLTTLHTNPPPRTSNGPLPQLSGRESVNNNPLSSGDVSQHTYDSLWKLQVSKGAELRRPPTADSAKTSNLDSDDNLDGEESN